MSRVSCITCPHALCSKVSCFSFITFFHASSPSYFIRALVLYILRALRVLVLHLPHTLFTPASLVLHGFQISSYLCLLFVLKQPYISDSIIYMIVPLNCNAWKWKRISYMRSLLVMITWLKHSKVFYDTPVSLFFAWKCLQLYPKKLNYVFQYEETKMLDQTY